MVPDDEQADVLTGKQIKTGCRGLEGLTAVVEDGIESETVLQRELRIVPWLYKGYLLVFNADTEILKIQIVYYKGKSGQVFDG